LLLNLLNKNNKINIFIKLKGLNKFKKIVIKQLQLYPINIISIVDETILAHNGCKKKSTRKL
jgi:ribosomal protein S11